MSERFKVGDQAGANAIVAGSAIFGVHDYAQAIAALRQQTRHEGNQHE